MLTLIRIIRLVFSSIIEYSGDILLIKQEYDTLNWITLGIQVILVVAQRIYPHRLNAWAVPLWMLFITISVNPKLDEYSLYTFLFK